MMKNLLYIVIFLFSCVVHAQDTTYFSQSLLRNVSTVDSADFISIATRNVKHKKQLFVQRYFNNWQIESERKFSDYSKFIRHGEEKEWYSNGNLKRVSYYKKGELVGNFITYWENGTIKRRDIYNSGEFVTGECYDQNGRRITYFPYKTFPEFVGNLHEYLSKNTNYPEESIKNKIGGRVVVQFIVRKDGSTDQITVAKGINEELNNEAIRLIKNMPKWIPETIDGEATDTRFTIPIQFTPN